MKLSDRLAHPGAEPTQAALKPATSAGPAAADIPVLDDLLTLKARVGAALFERLGNRLSDPNLIEDELLVYAREVLT